MDRGERPHREDTSYDVFISYHSADLDAATTLAQYLRNQGIDVYLDVWRVLPGDLVQEAIEGALARSTSCVVLVGPGGPSPNGFGRWQHEEVRSAISQRVGDPEFRVIPVLLPGTAQDVDTLPSLLRRHSACDFRTGLDNEAELRRLTTAIRTRLTPLTTSAVELPPTRHLPSNPRTAFGVPMVTWPRRSIIDKVCGLLDAGQNAIVLYGLTGMGKTVALCDIADEVFRHDDIEQNKPFKIMLTGNARQLTRISDSTGSIEDLIPFTIWKSNPKVDGCILLLDDIGHDWNAAHALEERAREIGLICIIASARTRPPAESPFVAVQVGPLSSSESMDLITHQVATRALPITPKSVVDALPGSVLSHPQALANFVTYISTTPVGLIRAGSQAWTRSIGAPVDVIAEAIANLSADDQLALAFADLLSDAPLGTIDELVPLFPTGFAEAIGRLVQQSFVHVTVDGLSVPELVSTALDQAATDSVATATEMMTDAVRVAMADFDAAHPVAWTNGRFVWAEVLPPIANSLARHDEREKLAKLLDVNLLELLNWQQHWAQYAKLSRIRITMADQARDLATQVEARCRLARKVAQQGDTDSARQLISEAERLVDRRSPRNLRADVHFHWALLAHWQNDIIFAYRELEKSVRLTAKQDTERLLGAYNLAGNISLRQKQYRRAAAEYQRTLTLTGVPRDAKIRLEAEASLAVCEIQFGHEETASARLDDVASRMRAVGMNAQLPRVLHAQALLAERGGRPTEARELARVGVELQSPDPSVHSALENLLDRLSTFPELSGGGILERRRRNKSQRRKRGPGHKYVYTSIERWPRYLADAINRSLPPNLSEETAAALTFVLYSHPYAFKHDDMRSPKSVLESFMSGKELKDRWVTDGGNLADLMKIIAMADFRRSVIRPVDSPYGPAGGGFEAPRPNRVESQKLRDF